MQMKKQNWKRIRNVKPCMICGKDHETKICVTRKGSYRKN